MIWSLDWDLGMIWLLEIPRISLKKRITMNLYILYIYIYIYMLYHERHSCTISIQRRICRCPCLHHCIPVSFDHVKQKTLHLYFPWRWLHKRWVSRGAQKKSQFSSSPFLCLFLCLLVVGFFVCWLVVCLLSVSFFLGGAAEVVDFPADFSWLFLLLLMGGWG